ncbi:MAG: universal stress protein, partial [Chloroflexi bacterium]|nr:universal stress protein [Chloroflexota bacterium]
MFKRILVPLDGSETAEIVLPFVITEARLHNATVLVLRVVAPLRQSLMASPGAVENAYRGIEKLAEDYLETISAKTMAEGLEIETIVKMGKPAVQIIEVARKHECDLIAVSTHGETGGSQWRFG